MNPSLTGRSVASATVRARILHADGTVTDLGIVAEKKPTRFIRIKRWFRRLVWRTSQCLLPRAKKS